MRLNLQGLNRLSWLNKLLAAVLTFTLVLGLGYLAMRAYKLVWHEFSTMEPTLQITAAAGMVLLFLFLITPKKLKRYIGRGITALAIWLFSLPGKLFAAMRSSEPDEDEQEDGSDYSILEEFTDTYVSAKFALTKFFGLFLLYVAAQWWLASSGPFNLTVLWVGAGMTLLTLTIIWLRGGIIVDSFILSGFLGVPVGETVNRGIGILIAAILLVAEYFFVVPASIDLMGDGQRVSLHILVVVLFLLYNVARWLAKAPPFDWNSIAKYQKRILAFAVLLVLISGAANYFWNHTPYIRTTAATPLLNTNGTVVHTLPKGSQLMVAERESVRKIKGMNPTTRLIKINGLDYIGVHGPMDLEYPERGFNTAQVHLVSFDRIRPSLRLDDNVETKRLAAKRDTIHVRPRKQIVLQAPAPAPKRDTVVIDTTDRITAVAQTSSIDFTYKPSPYGPGTKGALLTTELLPLGDYEGRCWEIPGAEIGATLVIYITGHGFINNIGNVGSTDIGKRPAGNGWKFPGLPTNAIGVWSESNPADLTRVNNTNVNAGTFIFQGGSICAAVNTTGSARGTYYLSFYDTGRPLIAANSR